MAQDKLPYVVSTGSLTKALEKIRTAATPERFTIDFLGSKLGLSGGSARPVIPFLKRTGFLASDGTPTDLYRRFRNKGERGAAAAEALHKGYDVLFQANESAQDASDDDLRGLIVQLTGVEEGSRVLTATLASFKALREYADFDALPKEDELEEQTGDEPSDSTTLAEVSSPPLESLSIGYTINLHLPATSDIAVFNAIFKSLRENLLR